MRSVLLPTRLFLGGMGVSLVLSGSVAPAALTQAAPSVSAEAASPTMPSADPDARPVEFRRAPDGLFYMTGRVNGRSIRFLVDTGASVVMLTREDAAALNVVPAPDALRSRLRTANGASAMAWTTLRNIDVAGRRVAKIDAAVPESGLPVSLLGQNLLRELGIVTIEGDSLRVHGAVVPNGI